MANLFEEATPADVSFEEMIACVDRELRMRAEVYPRWVKAGKLQQEMADRQMLAMRAVRLRLLQSAALMLREGTEPNTPPHEVLARLQQQYPEPQL